MNRNKEGKCSGASKDFLKSYICETILAHISELRNARHKHKSMKVYDFSKTFGSSGFIIVPLPQISEKISAPLQNSKNIPPLLAYAFKWSHYLKNHALMVSSYRSKFLDILSQSRSIFFAITGLIEYVVCVYCSQFIKKCAIINQMPILVSRVVHSGKDDRIVEDILRTRMNFRARARRIMKSPDFFAWLFAALVTTLAVFRTTLATFWTNTGVLRDIYTRNDPDHLSSVPNPRINVLAKSANMNSEKPKKREETMYFYRLSLKNKEDMEMGWGIFEKYTFI